MNTGLTDRNTFVNILVITLIVI